MVFVPSSLERSDAPSQLNTSSSQNGVLSQLTDLGKNIRPFDGVTLDDMRGNPMYSRHDDIDAVGLVQNKVIEMAKTLKKNAKVIRAFNDHAQKLNKPKVSTNR